MNSSSNRILKTAAMIALVASSAAAQSTTSTDPSDGSWLVPSSKLDETLPYWLQFSGEERARAEGTIGIGYKPNATDRYLLNRLRLDMKLLPTDWLKFEFQSQDSRAIWREEAEKPPYQDTWDLRLAYVEVGDLEKYHAAFRVGRQELAFGDERLVGISNWTNVARSYDGYRLSVEDGKFRLDAFATSVVVLNDGEVGQHTPGNYLEGLYGQMENVIPDSTIQPYFLWRRNPGQKMDNGQLATEDFGTTGFRWVGRLPLGFDYGTEIAMQRGTLGEDRVSAWASHLVIGYKIPTLHSHPTRYVAEYNFASGTPNPKDGVHSTFDTLYASAHNKIELADQIGWKNIQHIRTGLDFALSKKISSSFRYSDMWLANAHDALYNSSGVVVAQSASGVAGRWVGQELDAVLGYKTAKHSEFGAGFGYILPGTFLKLTTPGHTYSYPFMYYNTWF